MDRQLAVRIIYSYDGSKFYGMQRQKNLKTVQGEIEKVINCVFNENINLISSGRTDAFVHAKMQVSNFVLSKNIPLEKIKNQINKTLFGKVRIYNISEVDMNFNSRFNATKRIYEYILKYEKDIQPFESLYVTKIPNNIQIDCNLINDKLNLFLGTHDFQFFCKKDESKINTVRTIYSATVEKKDDCYIFLIEGNGFLKSMIRLLVASCIYDDIESIRNKLQLIDTNKPKKFLSLMAYI